MQGVGVLGSRAAGGQQAGVEGEASVGLRDLRGGQRLAEHVVHPQADAVATASQMICPMNGRISRRVRELVMMRVSTPLE